MRQKKKLELLLILACIASFGLCFKQDQLESPPTSAPTAKAKAPIKAKPQTVSIPTVFRWSAEGGCYQESDFFFELRSDESGASWIALLCAYGYWEENLPEDPMRTGRQAGCFVDSGRLGIEETNRFIEELESTKPLRVRSEWCDEGPSYSLYVRLGEESNKVARFQYNLEAKPFPNYKLCQFGYSGFIQTTREALELRFNNKEQPDYPLGFPGHYWLTKEEQTLFSIFSEHLPTKRNAGSKAL